MKQDLTGTLIDVHQSGQSYKVQSNHSATETRSHTATYPQSRIATTPQQPQHGGSAFGRSPFVEPFVDGSGKRSSITLWRCG